MPQYVTMKLIQIPQNDQRHERRGKAMIGNKFRDGMLGESPSTFVEGEYHVEVS